MSFNPHQYAIDRGWSWDCILETANKGISEADMDALSAEDGEALEAWCRRRVIGQAIASTRARLDKSQAAIAKTDELLTRAGVDPERSGSSARGRGSGGMGVKRSLCHDLGTDGLRLRRD